ncbi:alpha-mannosyltransferase [Arachidicoccus soli]|nr:hypothetical protein [Arachidicoccus soli]
MSKFLESGFREVDFRLNPKSIQLFRSEWREFIKTIPSFPKNKYKGKGIVICGGGVKYFTCAWISINLLRLKGCSLPIELWYIGNEVNKDILVNIEKLNVRCRNLLDFDGNYQFHGWALKPFAILHSGFKEIIFIDADNVCMTNPEFLFELEEYKQTGVVFWPDYWKTTIKNPIWDILDISYVDMREQDSGQMVVNKEKSWQALNLALFLNESKDIYYRLLLGDKDTFRYSWMALKKDFFFIEHEPDTCGYIDSEKYFGMTMLQKDANNAPLFLHRNLVKWDVTKNDELLWQKIKSFNRNSKSRTFIAEYSNRKKHHYIDFQGDFFEKNFIELCGDIELECLHFLRVLRSKKFFNNLMIFEYINKQRNFINFPSS